MVRCVTLRIPAQVSTIAAVFNAFLLLLLPASAMAQQDPVQIVAFGDSLTAGLGLQPSDALPAQLERALNAKGFNVRILNAGVSGDTTAAGLQRFDWAVPDKVDAAILALGANDALRGIDPSQTRRNLDEIITRLKARGAEVLVAGMRAPRNWGDDYIGRFDPIFTDLAKKHGALLYPFILDKVALQPSLNLSDGMHPNSKGVAVMVEAMLPVVEELIGRVNAKRGSAAAK